MYMIENPKTVVDIAMQLMDDFHDDIDSDDPPVEYSRSDGEAGAQVVDVLFESGACMRITIEAT